MRQAMDLTFGGLTQSLNGEVEMESVWDSIKKSLISWLLTWGLAVILVLVPFINWTLPTIFFAAGPILAIAIYIADRRVVHHLDAATICPQCKTSFAIHEQSFSPPIYGQCPHCKADYQLSFKSFKRERT